LIILSSALSESCPDRSNTRIEFSDGSFVDCEEAIMPVIVITPKRTVIMLKRSIPTKDAKTNLKNCFMKNLILIYFAKIYIIGGNSKYFMIS
jgi:hypothetical protein